jgi:hypothetical protein
MEPRVGTTAAHVEIHTVGESADHGVPEAMFEKMGL